MCFNKLFDSLNKNELILLEGAMCRFHLRKDGQLTIHEIISTIPGAGQKMLTMLKRRKPHFIIAKCPEYLEANEWYQKRGFVLSSIEESKSGTKINVWKLNL